MFAFLISFLLCEVFAAQALAVSAAPGEIEVRQPGGEIIKARLKGDEWSNWVETPDGFTIAKGLDASWYYVAGYDRDKPVLTSRRANDRPDAAIASGLKPEPSVSNPRAIPALLPLPSSPYGVFNGKVLYIIVDYSNQPADPGSAGHFANQITQLNNYYNTVSHGKATMTPASETSGANNGVIGPLRLAGSHPDPGSVIDTTNQQISKDAIIAADPYINYAQYDANSDGYLDSQELSIVVVVAGYEAAASGLSPSVWAHAWGFSTDVGEPQPDGVQIWNYCQIGERHGSSHLATLGITAHELGHLTFGLPDLYDTSGSTIGLGYWCLMSNGSWGYKSGEYSGQTPVIPNAWIRQKLGWDSPVSDASSFSLTAAGSSQSTSSNTSYRANTNNGSQYFMVENREPLGYDQGLYMAGSGFGGLAIFHIDESCYGNSDTSCRLVDLEPADNTESYSSSTIDTWRASPILTQTGFTGTSIPNSDLNRSGGPSGIGIVNISGAGEVMTGQASLPPLPHLTARIEIDHTYVGDLVVTVGVGNPSSPQWSQVVSNREGGGNDNLYRTVDVSAAAGYFPPTDQRRWFLKVEDNATFDEGAIVKFAVSDNVNGVTYNAEDVPLPVYDNSTAISYVPQADVTAPVTADDAPASWQKTDFNVSLSCTDAGSGCQETHYRVDTGADTVGNTVTVNTNGEHTIVYHSVDNSGNVEADKSATARLDKAAPTVSNVQPAGTVSGSLQTIEADLADTGGSGINSGNAAIALDGGAALDGCTVSVAHISCPAAGLSVGNHSISVAVSDNADNSGAGAGSFTVATPAPNREYYWTWYDNVFMRNWVLMANPAGSGKVLDFDLSVGGVSQNLAPFAVTGQPAGKVPEGETITPIYNNLIGGPVKVTSKTGDKAIVSQRSLMGNSFEEVLGQDAEKLSDHFYWTWYDQLSPGYRNWILVANPSATETVRAEIRIAGNLMQNRLDPGSPDYNQYYFDIEPGKNVTPEFPGTMGGYVEVKAYLAGGAWPGDRRNVMASQRVLSNGATAFNEVPGIPAAELSNSYEWTWYDALSAGFKDWILVANPNGADVTYQVKIGGDLMPCHGTAPGTADIISTTCTLTPGQSETPQYPGDMNGPVEVISQGGNVIASQRVIAGPSFEEVPGYPTASFASDYHWSWYDGQSTGARDWILVSNRSGSDITYQIKIGGTLMPCHGTDIGVFDTSTSCSLTPGSSAMPVYPGLNDGPVEVIASGTVMVSQRVMWNGYFNEVLGTVLQ